MNPNDLTVSCFWIDINIFNKMFFPKEKNFSWNITE